MATLEGRSVASSYKDLLQVSNSNSGIDSTSRLVSDGEGTNSILYLSTGRVGIGKSPQTKFEVNLDTNKNLNFSASYMGSIAGILGRNDANDAMADLGLGGSTIRFSVDGTNDAMRLDSSGNLLIGSASSTGKLQITRSPYNGAIDVDQFKAVTMFMDGDSYWGQKAQFKLGRWENASGSHSRSSLQIALAHANVADDADADVNVMTLLSSGMVGIGTENPSDYDAGANNFVIYENGNSGITIASATTGIGAIHFADGTTGTDAYRGIVRYSHNDENLQFGVAGNNYRFKLDNNSRISLSNNDGGSSNTILGYSAGASFAGVNSTIIGHEAGLDATGGAGNSTLIGMEAGKHLNGGTYNTAIGIEAMKSTGSGNTALGNTCIGWRSGDFLKTGTYNVLIGHASEVSATDATNQIVIGREAVGQRDNSVTLGNGDVTDVYMAQDSGATVHADYVLSQGNQNHVANTMSSPYYRFDGVDDYIQILADGSSTFNTQHFTIEAMVYIDTMSSGSDSVIIWSYDNTAHSGSFYAQHLRVDQDGQIYFGYNSSGTVAQTTASAGSYNSYFDKWTHIVASYTSGSQKIYLNGNEVASDTDSGTITYYAQEVWINGANFGVGKSAEFSRVRFFNKVCTATEVKELYSGASVPFKYKGANQTDLVETHDAGSGTAWTGATGTTPPDGWSAQGSNRTYTIDSGSGSGSEPALQIGSGTAGNAGIIWGGTASLGKRYRATFSYKNDASTVVRTVTNEGTTTLADSTSWTHNQTIEWTGDGASGDFAFTVVTANKNAYIDNVVIQQIGAVAEYDGSGIASDKWLDKSGNDLHGTTSGNPSVENAPAGDDGLVYEEGTWTAVYDTKADDLSNFSMYSSTGVYKRIGNMVTVSATMSTTGAGSISSSSNNDIVIEGLPYTCNSTQRNISAIVAGRFQNAPDRAIVASGTTEIELRRDFETTLKVGDFTASASNNQNVLEFIITYFI